VTGAGAFIQLARFIAEDRLFAILCVFHGEESECLLKLLFIN